MPVDTSFAQSLIGIMQQARAAQRQREIDRQAEEDRRLEREGMKLRLSQMRFEDRANQLRIRRQGAREQFEALQGMPVADLSPEMIDGLPARAAVPGHERTLINRMRPVEFPGDPELGIAGFSRRPETQEGMQQVLAARAAEARREILRTPRQFGNRLVTPEGPDGRPIVHYELPQEPGKVTFPRAPEELLVDGQRRLVVTGSDGGLYLAGNTSTPLTPERVRPLPAGTTTTQERQRQDRARNRLTVAMSAPSPSPANIAAARRAIESAGFEWDVEKELAAQRVEATRLATASRRRSLDVDADDVADAQMILESFNAAEQVAPAGAAADGGAANRRTATLADVREVARRLNITEAEARRRLIAEGVRLAK